MRTACALWLLMALFALRVLGLVLFEFVPVRFLPPTEAWFSTLVPFPRLLASQVLILLLMSKIGLDFTRKSGWSYRPRVHVGGWLLIFGGMYLAVIVLCYIVRMTLFPHERWTGGLIPIVFNGILALYILVLGLHHWRVRIRKPSLQTSTRWWSSPVRIGQAAGAVVLVLAIALWARFHQHRLPKSFETSEVSISQLSFRDDAAALGLAFRYFTGVSGQPTHRMFEFTGGGVGVLDFDLDGWSEAYFSQGRTWTTESTDADHGDRLFRNRNGVHFDDVTAMAGIVEAGFGQGVSIGDFNSDGFPDVYVANIGANQLWRNNGDGTFADTTAEAGFGGTEWTTSCVLADLTGDGLPDIYDVNYVMGQDVFERVCQILARFPRVCRPNEFDAQPDRLWSNEGNGRFRDATVETLGIEPHGMGLGVAVWDAHGAGRLSLLVANDTTPSFFFANESAGEGAPPLRECGLEAGLALNGAGQATGCMGVALGDVDEDGRIDVFITNFFNESNTLYLNRTTGVFEDRTRELGLHAPSFNMLGFGTQFLDADLDGRLELFVSNGHVDDVSRFGRPYRMPPQLFRGDGRTGFAEVDAGELGPYFQQKWLGRPVARLDWNRDGLDDLIVGHLDDDSALLTNTTAASGRFLSLKLFGVQTNRDAIGTTVRARIGDRTVVRQLTAGDGYQSSNERRIILGSGTAEEIDELEVHWPSGTVQRFTQVPVSQEALLREGGRLHPSSERR